MTEFRQFKAADPLAELRANQAVLAGRITALEARLAELEGRNTPAPKRRADELCRCGAVSPKGFGCTKVPGHAGEHVAWGDGRVLYARWTDTEPVPQWRALVDEIVLDRDMHPLAAVLYALHCLDVFPRARKSLARIVAVCEAQVGDGWQADPDKVPPGHWGITWLLAPLSHESPAWGTVADRAAAWLESLCTDGAA